MKKQKFKDRYVLGEGYPGVNYDDASLFYGPYGKKSNDIQICLKCKGPWLNPKMPKYRLVLEKIQNKIKRGTT